MDRVPSCRSECAAHREQAARHGGSHERRDGSLDFLEIVRKRESAQEWSRLAGEGATCTARTATMNTKERGRDDGHVDDHYEVENALSNRLTDRTEPSPKATSSSSETARCRSHRSRRPGSRRSSFIQILTSRSKVKNIFLPTTLGWGPPLWWWLLTPCR